ncbi:MAG: type II secretion system F family protein [Lachnospiraceae bacterium]|nr:type II secretion system F family protein [Lachnospiraceae bacterium]
MQMIPLLYLIPAALIALLWLISIKEQPPRTGPEGTGGIRGQFLKIGWLLYRTIPVFRRKNRSETLTAQLGVLEPRVSADAATKLYCADKIGMTLLVIFAGSVLAALVSWSARQEKLIDENRRIARPGYEETDLTRTLVLTAADDETMREEVELTVTARQYTKEEADALFAEMSKQLPERMLNGNPSLDEVRSDLTLPTQVPGYPFELSWRVGDYDTVHADGRVQTENIPPEGVVVTLTAQVSYLTYHWDLEFPVRFCPPLYTQEERWQQGIQAVLSEADRASVNEAYMTLPGRIGESGYLWTSKIRDDAGILFLLILLASGAIYVLRDKDLQKRTKEREEELIRDYPQFVSKLTLFMGAGMTVRSVFQRLAAEYDVCRKKGGERRYLMEEIRRTVHELESGMSETAAYEHFSLRCRTQPYTRLITLLSQNLRKGNSGLLTLLREESKKALAERMDMARKHGEEAGTKLLLPMMLMLAIVMVIIMIPAFLSF